MKPMNNMVIVEHEAARTTKGGLHLPDTSVGSQYAEGKVIAIGPGAVTDSGQRVPIPLKPDDIVIFDKGHAFDVTIDGKRLYCIDALRILVHLNAE